MLDKIKDSLFRPAEAAHQINESQFTERELSIMSLIAKGLSNREISKQLFISEGTTANYISSILGKRGLSTERRSPFLYHREGG